MIPYGRQCINDEDIKAVVETLRSDWLTTGPKVVEFEEAFSRFVGAKYAIAVNSGTSALHCAMYALGIVPRDEVVVASMTFAASANCVVYQGGTPVFADVSPDTLLIDPQDIERKITPKTKAIIAVDYAGQPCDYAALKAIADRHHLSLVADACHSLGATYRKNPVGSIADLSVFSFHPVKHITTGEGGMITTNNEGFAHRIRTFRNHGITSDHRQRESQGSWFYEMVDLGYNYRITDFQCALGLSQLKMLPVWISKRQEIALRYNELFKEIDGIEPLEVLPGVSHAYHLYVVRLDERSIGKSRMEIFHRMRAMGIGVNVHYIPVHMHPFYEKRFGTHKGMCPVAEEAYERIISLPMFPGLSEMQMNYIIEEMKKISLRG